MEEERGTALSPQQGPTTARIIHGALAVGVLMVFGILAYLRTVSGPAVAGDAAGTLRIVAYAVLAVGIVMTRVMRGRIAAPSPARSREGSGADLAEWWTTTLPKAIVVWALAEGVGMIGIVLGYVIADLTVQVIAVAVGLFLLFLTRPGALEGPRA